LDCVIWWKKFPASRRAFNSSLTNSLRLIDVLPQSALAFDRRLLRQSRRAKVAFQGVASLLNFHHRRRASSMCNIALEPPSIGRHNPRSLGCSLGLSFWVPFLSKQHILRIRLWPIRSVLEGRVCNDSSCLVRYQQLWCTPESSCLCQNWCSYITMW
jgi:hypothetical protein